jgi:hypothetical protein
MVGGFADVEAMYRIDGFLERNPNVLVPGVSIKKVEHLQTSKSNKGIGKDKMRKLTFVATAILCLAVYAPCQETRAKLTGLVTDATGAVVPNAPVEVVNTDTGAKVLVKSNGQGSYTAPFLQPGPYKIGVQMAGFKAYVHTGWSYRWRRP